MSSSSRSQDRDLIISTVYCSAPAPCMICKYARSLDWTSDWHVIYFSLLNGVSPFFSFACWATCYRIPEGYVSGSSHPTLQPDNSPIWHLSQRAESEQKNMPRKATVGMWPWAVAGFTSATIIRVAQQQKSTYIQGRRPERGRAVLLGVCLQSCQCRSSGQKSFYLLKQML